MAIVETTRLRSALSQLQSTEAVRREETGDIVPVAFYSSGPERQAQTVSLPELPAVLTLNPLLGTFYQDMERL